MTSSIQKCALLLFFISASVWASAPEWINYTASGQYLTVLAIEGNDVWAKAEDRLLKINKTTGDVVYYDRGNSGLPNNEIRAFAIDRNGTKWIGTAVDSVIVKFDGSNWTVIQMPDFGKPRYANNALAVDNNNHLWIGGTSTGLTKYDGATWTNFNSANSGLPTDYVSSLAFDTKGTLWIGTYAGLAKFDGTHWTTFDTLNSKIPGNRVWDVKVDDNDHVWVGAFGVGYAQTAPSKFDGDQWTTYGASDPVFSQIPVGCRGFERKGTLWFITSKGIQTYDGVRWTTYDASNSGLPNNEVTSIMFDENDAAWIGTYGGGIVRFDGHEWKKYNTLNSGMPPARVRSVVVDRLDHYWIGGDNGQIVMFDGKNWTSIDTSHSGILGDKIMSLAIDSVGNVFAGTVNQGLKKYDGRQWRDLHERFYGVFAIAIDPGGSVWVGTSTGVWKLQGEAWTHYGYLTPGFPQFSNAVSSIVVAPNGNIWVGCSGGLVKYDGVQWTTVAGARVGSTDEAAIEQNGTVWLGGSGSTAVGRFDGSTWTYYAPQFYSYASSVTAVAIDINGNKWVGSNHGGVAKFNEFAWTYYNTSNSGLASDDVSSMAIDSQGNKLFATSGGLSIYHKGGVISDVPAARNVVLPRTVMVSQNFPNPFNPSTTISYTIPHSAFVRLTVYDLLGREVTTLVNEFKAKGQYSVSFNAQGLPSGVYVYKIQSGGNTVVKKMLLLR